VHSDDVFFAFATSKAKIYSLYIVCFQKSKTINVLEMGLWFGFPVGKAKKLLYQSVFSLIHF
jgi:hypothetical protein